MQVVKMFLQTCLLDTTKLLSSTNNYTFFMVGFPRLIFKIISNQSLACIRLMQPCMHELEFITEKFEACRLITIGREKKFCYKPDY